MTRNILAISYAKRVLDANSREQERMKELATGVDRYVMVVFTRAAEGLLREYHDGSLSVYATHSRSRLFMLWDAYRIARRVLHESEGEWVVSAQDPFATSLVAYPLARLTGYIFHIQIHGDHFNNTTQDPVSFTDRLWRWFGVRMLRRANRIRVVSLRAKRALLQLGRITAPISILPVQTNLKPFLRAGAERTTEAVDEVHFLYVGRFSPEKDIARIVRLFAQVYQIQPRTSLTLLGEGQEREAIEQVIEECGVADVVTLHPWTEAVPLVMQKHDVLVLASQHEGFALVLLEAMAAGLAVLTTDVGCVGEWCLPNEHCLVLSANDDEAATATWLRLAEDASLRQQLATAGHQAALNYQKSQEDYKTAWTASFFG